MLVTKKCLFNIWGIFSRGANPWQDQAKKNIHNACSDTVFPYQFFIDGSIPHILPCEYLLGKLSRLGNIWGIFFSLARSKSCSDATGKYKNGGKAPLKRCRIFSLQHFAARWSQARAIFLRRGVGYFLFNLFDFFMGRVDGQERKKQSLNIKQQRLSLSSSRTKKNAHCHQTLRVRFSLSRTNPRT